MERPATRLENSQAIRRGIKTLLQRKVPTNGKKVCQPINGKDYSVCIYASNPEKNGHRTVEVTVEDQYGSPRSHQLYDFVEYERERLVQVRSHLSTAAHQQSQGYASGLISETNDVISYLIHSNPQDFEGKTVRGVIEDDATRAYDGVSSMSGVRNGWSSHHAQRLGYERLASDFADVPVWVKTYSVHSLRNRISSIAQLIKS